MDEIESRYPKFTNPELFINLCDQLKQNGNMTSENCLLLRRFHQSIIHKLTSGVFCLENLSKLIQNRTYISDLTSTGTATAQEFDEHFQIFFYQDHFFSSLISSFDILALKLNLIYNSPISNVRNCYFSSLVNTLVQTNATGIIEHYLDQIRNASWYQDTVPFRICLTHRQQPDFTINIEVVAGTPVIKHFLPDDPLTLPYTYNNQREIIPFCQDKMGQFVSVTNAIDGLLRREATRIGHIPF